MAKAAKTGKVVMSTLLMLTPHLAALAKSYIGLIKEERKKKYELIEQILKYLFVLILTAFIGFMLGFLV